MYNTRKAALRKQGLTEKQIEKLSDMQNEVFEANRQKHFAEQRYYKLLEKWVQMEQEYGVDR
jgi:hypothetical protein